MPLAAQDIVSLACAVAKVPGYLTTGGKYLNLVLKDLWLHRDLKVNRITQPITVTANGNGPFNLEANYQRTYDLFYLQNNLPYFLHPIGMDSYDAEFKDPSISNYPYEYATDLSTQAQVASGSTGQLFVYPQSSGLIVLTHRYMCKQPEIVAPESSPVTPWFEDQDWLIKATATRLFDITDDSRKAQYREELEQDLRIHLIMEGDEQAVVKAVKLDPRRFHGNRSVRPTKVTG
jgi:hypothetical protein